MNQRTLMALYLGFVAIAMMMDDIVSALFAVGCGMLALYFHSHSDEKERL